MPTLQTFKEATCCLWVANYSHQIIRWHPIYIPRGQRDRLLHDVSNCKHVWSINCLNEFCHAVSVSQLHFKGTVYAQTSVCVGRTITKSESIGPPLCKYIDVEFWHAVGHFCFRIYSYSQRTRPWVVVKTRADSCLAFWDGGVSWPILSRSCLLLRSNYHPRANSCK